MIELAFGESAGGGLKLAKSTKQGERLSGAVAVFGGSKKEKREARKPCVWTGMTMEGSPGDVEALTLALDIGDISDMDMGMHSRRKLLNELFADFQGVSDSIWETNQHALKRINEARATLEPVRMWISFSDPVEMCGLYFICHFMIDSKAPLSIVRIPSHAEKNCSYICYRSTGEIPAEEFGAFVKYEEFISPCQRSTYANIWCGLMHENAPLRAIVNGHVISVPADFYDFVLYANIPDGEFRVAQLIGKALNQITGVSDRWLYLRIQAMIQAGELIEVSPATDDHPYSGIIRRYGKTKHIEGY